MQKFVDIPKVKNSNDVQDLRFLFDSVDTSVQNLQSLNVDTSGYGSLLVPLLGGKLPGDLKVIFARKFESNVWNLDEMLKFLKTEIQAKERSVSVTAINSNEKDSKKNEINKFTTSALFSQNSKFKGTCEFCNLKNHTSSKCLKITEPFARKNIVRQKGLCFICFSNEHLATSCKSNYICRKCNGRHHIIICTFSADQNPPKNPITQNRGDGAGTTSNNLSTSKNSILLQTILSTTTNLKEKL